MRPPGQAITLWSRFYRSLCVFEEWYRSRNPIHLDRQISNFISRGDYAREEAILLRLIKVTERTNGQDAVELLRYLRFLAGLRCWLGQYEEAKNLFRRVLTIQEMQLPADSADLLDTLEMLDLLSRLNGDTDQAIALMRRILRMRAALFGQEDLGAAGIYQQMGVLLEEKGEQESANQLLKHAATIRKKYCADPDEAAYAFEYFGRFYNGLFNRSESFEITHYLLEHSPFRSRDREVLRRAQNNYSIFVQRAGERMLAEYPGRITFNRCPQCGRVTRTPTARQCRYCRHDWHN